MKFFFTIYRNTYSKKLVQNMLFIQSTDSAYFASNTMRTTDLENVLFIKPTFTLMIQVIEGKVLFCFILYLILLIDLILYFT